MNLTTYFDLLTGELLSWNAAALLCIASCTCCSGDDLIGPRDIKKGLHMLANANVKVLEDEEEDEDQDAQTDIDLEANRKKRIAKHDKNDTLTSEQMNQVTVDCSTLSTCTMVTMRLFCMKPYSSRLVPCAAMHCKLLLRMGECNYYI